MVSYEMMIFKKFAFLLLIHISLQETCDVNITSPVYTDCEDERWDKVRLQFEPDNPIDLSMSEVCKKGGTASFQVNIENVDNINNGYLKLIQLSVGPRTELPPTSEWFVETITINCPNNKMATFRVGRMIEVDRLYDLSNFDTNINHGTCEWDQNIQEISLKRFSYLRARLLGNGPYMSQSLNKETLHEHQLRLANLVPTLVQVRNIKESLLPGIIADPIFRSFDEIIHFYDNTTLPKIEVMDYWDQDSWFAAQRLLGCNPTLIKRVQELPEQFQLNSDRAKTIMAEDLSTVMEGGRLFIADLELFEDIEGAFAPMALFYVDSKKKFKPMAIQLTRTATAEQVYYIDDSEYDWLLAKMYFNLMDAQYHQLRTHLSLTHFVIDAISGITFQNLPPSHPVYRLIKQHLYESEGVNIAGAIELLKPEGLIDTISVLDAEKSKLILDKVLNNLHYDELNPVIDNKNRKTRKIMVYPFRDRALPLFGAIKSFVFDTLSSYYDDKKAVKADADLKTWRQALVRENSCQGAAIMGLPGDDEKGFKNVNDIADTVATFIWIATAAHASAHNCQYHQHAFHPNYPMTLKMPPPSTKNQTQDDLVSRLGNKVQVFANTQIVFVFRNDGTGDELGNYVRPFLTSPADAMSIEKFQEALEQLKNVEYPDLEYSYEYLNIDQIKNSIRA